MRYDIRIVVYCEALGWIPFSVRSRGRFIWFLEVFEHVALVLMVVTEGRASPAGTFLRQAFTSESGRDSEYHVLTTDKIFLFILLVNKS